MKALILTLALSITSISAFSVETKHGSEVCMNDSRSSGKVVPAPKTATEVKASSVTKD
jgi:hypothetical protein